MRIPDQSVQLRFRLVRRRFVGRYRRAVGPVEAVALLNVAILAGMLLWASGRWVLRPGIHLQLPEAPMGDGAPAGARTVALTQEGLCFWDDERVDFKELERRLAEDGAGEGGALLIEADERTPYGRLIELYGMAARAGVREVVLGTRPPPRAVLPSGRAVPEREGE